MIENYTMGPNSTSLFILTLRKLQTIRQQGNTLPAVAFNFRSPTSSHRRTGDVWRHAWRSVLKNLGRLKAGILFLFLIWNDCAFINSLQAGASETA